MFVAVSQLLLILIGELIFNDWFYLKNNLLLEINATNQQLARINSGGHTGT
jgi:hypothetical protein